MLDHASAADTPNKESSPAKHHRMRLTDGFLIEHLDLPKNYAGFMSSSIVSSCLWDIFQILSAELAAPTDKHGTVSANYANYAKAESQSLVTSTPTV
jgi:hypothetical protein